MLGFGATTENALAESPADYQVTGFRPVFFGVARTPLFARATGFLAANFGTPAIRRAVGFQAVNFGTPRLLPIARVTGFAPAIFGTPRGVLSIISGRTTTLRATKFGTPARPSRRVFLASGFLVARSSPLSIVPIVKARPTKRRTLRVVSLRPVRFGAPLPVTPPCGC